MQLSRWKRFRWDLERLEPPLEPPARFTIRPALKEEEDAIRKTVLSAFSMGLAWADAFRKMNPDMIKTFDEQFPLHPEHTQVVLHGTRIMGASMVTTDPDAANHLITGPCIIHEYRSRGLGSALLRASLEVLRAEGLTHAYGVTADRSVAARFVYPKFGGVMETYHINSPPGPQVAA